MVRSMMVEYHILSYNITLGSSFSSIFELGSEASSLFLFLSHKGGFELWIFRQIEEGMRGCVGSSLYLRVSRMRAPFKNIPSRW